MSSALDSLPEGFTFGGMSSSQVEPEETATPSSALDSLPEGFTFGGRSSSQQPTPQEQTQDTVPLPATVDTLEKGTYTETDLKDDKYYGIVSEYMKNRYNIEESEDYNREEITTMFMNNMRGFAGGNTVRAISEVSYLNGLSEEKLSKVGEAYTLFEGMANLYSDETSFGEAAGGTWDYVRSALVDPVNLVSLGVGKVFASAGTKVAIKSAQGLAKAAMKRELARGATKEAAEEAGKAIFRKQAERLSRKSSLELAKKQGKKSAIKEVGATMVVDAVQAAGTAYAYEKSMVRTDVQDEVSMHSVGLAALGVMILGGTAGAFTVARSAKSGGLETLGTEALSLPSGVNPNLQPLESMTDMFGFNFFEGEKVIKNMTQRNPETGMDEAIEGTVVGFKKGQVLVQLPDGNTQLLRRADLRLADNTITGGNEGAIGGRNGWEAAVSRGYAVELINKQRRNKELLDADPNFVGPPPSPKPKSLDELDQDFFKTLLLGNKDLRVRGIVEAMAEQGYIFQKRNKDDTITRFVTDAIRSTGANSTAHRGMMTKFLEDFTKATGITEINLGVIGKGKVDKIEKLNIDNFADYLSYRTSDAAKTLNNWSQAQEALRVTELKLDNTTYDDWLRAAVLQESPDEVPLNAVGKFLDKYVSEGIKANQNRVIRLLVSNPSTSALNLVGWGAATGINSVADIGVGIVQLNIAATYKILGKNEKAAEQLREASSLFMANKQRLRNLLDPEMTYDAFKSLGNKNPQLMKDLTETLSGGVDAGKMSSFDPKKTIAGQGADKFIDTVQTLTFVKAQDAFTKSQEFTYQLDKRLRKDFNKSWSEFFSDENADVAMKTFKFKQAMADAVVETQAATFSKSFADTGTFPKFIEEMRNIPGVGLIVPFGRFFNNTLNFIVEGTGVAMPLKLATGRYKTKSQKELAMKAGIGYGIVLTYADQEKFNREQGLNWDQYRDRNGAVITVKYDFPISHLKAGAALMSYVLNDQKIPPDMLKDMSDQLGFGSITRQLNQTVDGLGSTLSLALTGDEAAIKELQKVSGKMLSQVASGVTRAVDPINQIVGLARGEDGISIDRRQNGRVANDSLRYMDQIIGAIGGDLAPQRFNAATGKKGQDATKLVGIREVKVTDTAKMMNMIGKPSFKADISINTAGSAEGSNRYAEVFHSFVEYRAGKLIRSNLMNDDKYSLKDRQKQVKMVLEDAKGLTEAFMELGAVQSNDRVLFKMMKLVGKANSVKALDKIVKEMGVYDSFSDLADVESESEVLDQLVLIGAYLDGEKYRTKILPKPY